MFFENSLLLLIAICITSILMMMMMIMADALLVDGSVTRERFAELMCSSAASSRFSFILLIKGSDRSSLRFDTLQELQPIFTFSLSPTPQCHISHKCRSNATDSNKHNSCNLMQFLLLISIFSHFGPLSMSHSVLVIIMNSPLSMLSEIIS